VISLVAYLFSFNRRHDIVGLLCICCWSKGYFVFEIKVLMINKPTSTIQYQTRTIVLLIRLTTSPSRTTFSPLIKKRPTYASVKIGFWVWYILSIVDSKTKLAVYKDRYDQHAKHVSLSSTYHIGRSSVALLSICVHLSERSRPSLFAVKKAPCNKIR
jgi:hypothetical protein